VRRVLAYAGVPTILEDLWLPGTPFKGLTAERLRASRGPMYAMFEAEFGVRMVRAEEKIRAVLPDAEQALLLDVATGTPLLSVERSRTPTTTPRWSFGAASTAPTPTTTATIWAEMHRRHHAPAGSSLPANNASDAAASDHSSAVTRWRPLPDGALQ